MLESKFTLTHVAWISLPQHSMSKPWHHLTTVQRFPEEILQLVCCDIGTKFLCNSSEPNKHFLNERGKFTYVKITASKPTKAVSYILVITLLQELLHEKCG